MTVDSASNVQAVAAATACIERSPLTCTRQQRLSWPAPPKGFDEETPQGSPQMANICGASPVATPQRSRRRLNPMNSSPVGIFWADAAVGLVSPAPEVVPAGEGGVASPNWQRALFSPIPRSQQRKELPGDQLGQRACETAASEASWSWRPQASQVRPCAGVSPPWTWRRSVGGDVAESEAKCGDRVTATIEAPEAIASADADASFVWRLRHDLPCSARALSPGWSWSRAADNQPPPGHAAGPGPRRLSFLQASPAADEEELLMDSVLGLYEGKNTGRARSSSNSSSLSASTDSDDEDTDTEQDGDHEKLAVIGQESCDSSSSEYSDSESMSASPITPPRLLCTVMSCSRSSASSSPSPRRTLHELAEESLRSEDAQSSPLEWPNLGVESVPTTSVVLDSSSSRCSLLGAHPTVDDPRWRSESKWAVQAKPDTTAC